jgi:hypothetical protein
VVVDVVVGAGVAPAVAIPPNDNASDPTVTLAAARQASAGAEADLVARRNKGY